MEEIVDLLQVMGATADEVAATLRAERVQGMRDSTSFMNPIVRYLNRRLIIGGWLEIGAGGVLLRLRLAGKVKEAPLPKAIQDFLIGFHRGAFPDLEVRDG